MWRSEPWKPIEVLSFGTPRARAQVRPCRVLRFGGYRRRGSFFVGCFGLCSPSTVEGVTCFSSELRPRMKLLTIPPRPIKPKSEPGTVCPSITTTAPSTRDIAETVKAKHWPKRASVNCALMASRCISKANFSISLRCLPWSSAIVIMRLAAPALASSYPRRISGGGIGPAVNPTSKT